MLLGSGVGARGEACGHSRTFSIAHTQFHAHTPHNTHQPTALIPCSFNTSSIHTSPSQVYQLLLGVTALSLLATPLVIMLCSRLLREPLSITTMGPRIPLMSDASSSPEAVQKNSARLALGKD